MSLILGTNCGFISTTPTIDPAAAESDGTYITHLALKDTSPVGDYVVTELGCYIQASANESVIQIGLYTNQDISEVNHPNVLLGVGNITMSGTSARWYSVTLDNAITLNSGTLYHIVIGSSSSSNMVGYDNIGGVFNRTKTVDPQSAILTNPWGVSGSTLIRGYISLYAKYEAPTSSGSVGFSGLLNSKLIGGGLLK